MIARNVTEADLQRALDAVNYRYGGNLQWRGGPPTSLNLKKGRFRFTITVYAAVMGDGSTGNFARVNYYGRRIPAACWHAHGLFFDELFLRCPSAIVRAAGRVLTAEDHWPDWRIGPAYFMFSQSCECVYPFAGARNEPGRSNQMNEATEARIHRFHEFLAVSFPGSGRTFYLSRSLAAQLAAALNLGCEDLRDCPDFSQSKLSDLLIKKREEPKI